MPLLRQHFAMFLFVFLFLTHDLHAGEHAEHQHGHGGGSIEVGLSNALVYTLGEKEFAHGLHGHVVYTFDESPFGLGLGYEVVRDEHQHQTVGLVMCYRPTDPLAFCLIPGLILEEAEAAFAAHVEASYEFTLGYLHLGPTAGLAYTSEDMHLSLGIHVGYAF